MTIISHQQQKKKKSTYLQVPTFSVSENLRNQHGGEKKKKSSQ